MIAIDDLKVFPFLKSELPSHTAKCNGVSMVEELPCGRANGLVVPQ